MRAARHQLLRLLEGGAFELVVSRPILLELRRTLSYPKIRERSSLSDEDLDLWVDSLGVLSIVVEGEPRRRYIPSDPDDDVYVATALEGLASYLVSGDRHLLELGEVEGVRILPARAFFELLAPEGG